MLDRPQKMTFGEVREMGVRGIRVYCADYKCSHSIAVSGDRWADDVGLSDIEGGFVCTACGKRDAKTSCTSAVRARRGASVGTLARPSRRAGDAEFRLPKQRA